MLFLSEIFPMKSKKGEAHPAYVAKVPFGQLLDIPSKNFIFLKTFSSKFSYIEV